jgi:hypothetical protein
LKLPEGRGAACAARHLGGDERAKFPVNRLGYQLLKPAVHRRKLVAHHAVDKGGEV